LKEKKDLADKNSETMVESLQKQIELMKTSYSQSQSQLKKELDSNKKRLDEALKKGEKLFILKQKLF
jgi:hypothetical protein